MKIASAILGSAVLIAAVAAGVPAQAADAYNASIAGQRNFGPLSNLSQSSTQTVDIVNLPAGVGLYALNCLVPPDPRSAPTVCDLSEGAATYLPAAGEARTTATLPVKVNAEFYGMNPNPTDGEAGGQSVDCRASTGNPRSTTCAVYVIGAGRDSANPAYLRVFPTSFLPVKAQRATDVATITLAGTAVRKGAKPALAVDEPTAFTVSLKSGLAPSVSATGCEIKDERITALSDKGSCIVRITSTGGRNYKPLVMTQVLRLTK